MDQNVRGLEVAMRERPLVQRPDQAGQAHVELARSARRPRRGLQRLDLRRYSASVITLSCFTVMRYVWRGRNQDKGLAHEQPVRARKARLEGGNSRLARCWPASTIARGEMAHQVSRGSSHFLRLNRLKTTRKVARRRRGFRNGRRPQNFSSWCRAERRRIRVGEQQGNEARLEAAHGNAPAWPLL